MIVVVLERLGEKSASHLDAVARASVKLLCQVPAHNDDDHEDKHDEEQVSSALLPVIMHRSSRVAGARCADVEYRGTIAEQ